MFRDFDPKGTSSWGIPGDVKNHYGGSGERVTPSGKRVYMNVLPQPSHLDSVNPVAMGKTRGIQDRLADERESIMMLNVHTDASFAAQGTIYETLGPSGRLHDGYVAGKIDPFYTDVAKMLDAPVFHVNGDDVEAVCSAAILAVDFRTRFKKDCVVDIICYRCNGHNEMDQASFTQPTMGYETGLIEQGIITREQVEAMKSDAWDKLMQYLRKSDDHKPDCEIPMELERETLPQKVTAIDHQAVEANLERILARRKQTVDSRTDIDWATAEALAFGTLLREGATVRVSRQDVERGTFSQRHSVLHDQQSNKTYTPLSTLGEGQGLFSITNSSLTENAAMGFEYGYSLADPNALVIWEAQFGDFANNSQCIIDNYIASSEEKWLQRSGVVLSLPHGYDGQGPEHTSSRLERFLQLGNEDSRSFPSPEQLKRQYQDCNIQVVCMTSPANYFHFLRRQVHREFRKPLIILFSKSLLRHPLARSDIRDFTETPYFQPLLSETEHGKTINGPQDMKRVIFCSGQVYAALFKHRKTHDLKDTAITRVEELHPFPWEQVRQNLDAYPNAKDIIWCQEETLNGGSWSHVMPRMDLILQKTKSHGDKRVRFVGRDLASGVAVGYKVLHALQEQMLLNDAFQIE
ncbi:oxoglutarate dehydrogenase (succinyl-transferring) [Aspergillus arachidicola]|uniref:Oxoglutarate dehydrogenase (Succinyl-transferring) n=1 Tax=Aspergillus arachidicola TaxID=656916 RepID=A0A2G7FVG0_9EURO|nr:oxoglutarate dehydrogenase (succinyl-transferring) [Aspergillus arachidicola]